MQLNRCISVSLSLSRSPVGLFSGSTHQMTLFSLTLLFVELRILRRQPAYCPHVPRHHVS